MTRSANIPNIFEYATSELSQDAFLCWLIACSDCGDAAYRNLGLDFIRFLYNSTVSESGGKIDREDVNGLTDSGENQTFPWRQHHKIDVYFQARIKKEKVSFIIEDKTATQMHSGQLDRYAEAVRDDDIEEDDIRKIYFKTGYVFENERDQAMRFEYGIVDLDGFMEFLSAHRDHIANNVFKDYLAYIEKTKKEMDSILAQAHDFHGNLDQYQKVFKHNYAQFEIMRSIKEEVEYVLQQEEGRLGSIEDDERLIYKTEIGGTWTQFYWHKSTGKYDQKDIAEYIFWRLDAGYQLRLRHGAWRLGGNYYSDFHEHRKDRLYLYREIFKEEVEKALPDAFKEPTGKTGCESSIGEIIFNTKKNSVKNVIKALPEFQRTLIRRFDSSGLLK
ncbi:MAG: PD-(D/E)XK nuclease family protein [bacterium]